MKWHEPPFLLKEFKIEVTHMCPMACIHCSSDASPSCDREIEIKQCTKILNEAARMGAAEVAFSGGEPLMWKGLYSAVETAIKEGLSVTIYSSGNLPNISLCLRELFRCGARKIVFSIFGSESRTHEIITRIEGSFDKTIEAVKLAAEIGLESEFHFVPMSDNYRQLSPIAKLASSLGVTKVSVLRFVPQGRGVLVKRHALTRLQNLELKKIIEHLRKEGYKIRTGSPFNFLFLNEQPICCAAIDRIIIGPDQRIYPCDAFKQIKAIDITGTDEYSVLGNHSLRECWEKSPYLNAVRKYLTTDFGPPCRNCGALESCLSGCLAQKVILNGNLNKSPDPMCLLIK